MEVRDRIHKLIDELSEPELEAVERMLQRIAEDPVLYAYITAPEDDEPESPGEAQAVAEAYDAIERGDVVTDDEIRRELGL